MSTKKSEIKIEYRIIAIRDSPVDAGKTEIMLRPTETELESGIENEPVMMMNGGMEALPPGMMQMIQQIPKQMGFTGKKQEAPKEIFLVEDEIEFRKKDWRHGDIIDVTFKKKGEER